MGDLISREFMKSIGGTCIAQRLKNGDLCPIISIDLLPSAEPERKKGHWIYYDEYAEAVTHTCSECGKRMTTAIGVKASYCWNCGAYMKEGEQHDTD